MTYEVFETCFLIPGVSTTACASWVQAWGSIAAIVGTVAVVRLQDRLQKKQAIEADRRRQVQAYRAIDEILETMRTSYMNLIRVLDHHLDMGTQPDFRTLKQTYLDDIAASLVLIPATSFPDFEVLRGYGLIGQNVRHLSVMATKLATGRPAQAQLYAFRSLTHEGVTIRTNVECLVAKLSSRLQTQDERGEAIRREESSLVKVPFVHLDRWLGRRDSKELK